MITIILKMAQLAGLRAPARVIGCSEDQVALREEEQVYGLLRRDLPYSVLLRGSEWNRRVARTLLNHVVCSVSIKDVAYVVVLTIPMLATLCPPKAIGTWGQTEVVRNVRMSLHCVTLSGLHTWLAAITRQESQSAQLDYHVRESFECESVTQA